MADAEPGEEIVVKLDGKKVALESLPPELKADVDRRIKEAREAYASKYPKGKLRLNINVKVKTSRDALKAAGGAGPAAPSAPADDDGAAPWPIVLVLALAVLGALYLFVPAFSNGVDQALDALRRAKTPAPAAAPTAAPR